MKFDFIISNDKILDGTVNPWFKAGISIIGDKIGAIGKLWRVRLGYNQFARSHNNRSARAPTTIRIIQEVVKLREEGILAWYSIDTGPSVFINTIHEYVENITDRLNSLNLPQIIVSKIGDKASIIQKLLF
jgi:hypothetical protein